MGQDRLDNLNLMNIESNLLKGIYLSSVISKFSHIKSRKVCL